MGVSKQVKTETRLTDKDIEILSNLNFVIARNDLIDFKLTVKTQNQQSVASVFLQDISARKIISCSENVCELTQFLRTKGVTLSEIADIIDAHLPEGNKCEGNNLVGEIIANSGDYVVIQDL